MYGLGLWVQGFGSGEPGCSGFKLGKMDMQQAIPLVRTLLKVESLWPGK